MRGLFPVLFLVLAGCSAGGGAGSDDKDVPPIDTPEGFVGIQGIVVDDRIVPIEGADVQLTGAGLNMSTTTDAKGAFFFDDLEPGNYFLQASHPLFDTVQQTVEFGGDTPPLVKVQLTRVIFASPYTQLLKFDGFLVCSVGFSVYASEECGEGVGVPCEVPVLGCQRVGGQEDNKAQWDFYVDGPFVRSMVLEMVWTANTATLEEFYFISATEWTCDPFCIGNEINLTTGGSPLRQTIDVVDGNATGPRGTAPVTSETRFSTFVWPNWGCNGISVPDDPECMQQLNVAVNQEYEAFAAISYYVPLPKDWSFVEGDELPF